MQRILPFAEKLDTQKIPYRIIYVQLEMHLALPS